MSRDTGLRAAALASLVPFLVSRALVWMGTELGARLLTQVHILPAFPAVAGGALAPFFHADAWYYAALMRYGYGPGPGSIPTPAYRAEFFPLYPYLAKAVGGTELGLLVIANVAFLAALAATYLVARKWLDHDRAQLALWLIALGPAAMFFSYPYSESLFLALSVLCFFLLDGQRWLLAGLVGAAAAMTRGAGVLLSLAFAGEFLRGAPRRVTALGALLPIGGLIAVGWVDQVQMGDPLGFLHAGALWVPPQPRNPLFPIGVIGKAVLAADPFRPEALALPMLLGFAAAAIWVARRMPLSYGIYAIAMVLLAVRTGWYVHSFVSVARYLAVIFPCYFAFATLLQSRRTLQLAWLLISASILLTYSALYGSGRFIG